MGLKVMGFSAAGLMYFYSGSNSLVTRFDIREAETK